MADKVPQTRGNHARVDPAFHYFFAPIGFLLIVWAIIHLIRHPGFEAAGIAGITVLVALIGFKARTYSLKVQDRVIRLEERLRLAMLLPEPLRARIPELSEPQLIALRFGSDDEVPLLAERALKENLTNKQVKELIRHWRPDYWRV
jgi:uncharacterized protein DUF6526